METLSAIASYGTEGDGNGVVLEYGKPEKKNAQADTAWKENAKGEADPFAVSTSDKGTTFTAQVVVTFRKDLPIEVQKVNAPTSCQAGRL